MIKQTNSKTQQELIKPFQVILRSEHELSEGSGTAYRLRKESMWSEASTRGEASATISRYSRRSWMVSSVSSKERAGELVRHVVRAVGVRLCLSSCFEYSNVCRVG